MIELSNMFKKKLRQTIKNTLKKPLSLYFMIATFLAIILTRLSVETWLSNFIPFKPTFYLYEFIHTTLFFYILFILCVFLTVKIANISIRSSIIIFLFGFLLIIIPPVIDWIISFIYFDGNNFISYYLFDSPGGLVKSYISFFGDEPRNGITYGTRIMIAFSLIFLSIITYTKTRNIFRALLIMIISYTIFFLLSCLPSLIAFVIASNHLDITRAGVAGIMASPTTILGNQISDPINAINIKMSLVYMLVSIALTIIILFKTNKKIFITLIKNIRPIQTMYHLGLLIIGISVGVFFADAVLLPNFFSISAFFLLCIAVVFAWYSTVIFNDYIDQDIDKISNPKRPLIIKIISAKHYTDIGILLAILSIIITSAINAHAAIALIAYQAISFLYNTPPLRLKRFPFIATFLAAIASFFIVVVGFITVTPAHSLHGFPPHIAILLIISYTISLPIKDLKDIAGDKANNIYTIPVLFGEKTARTIIGVGIFISYILSIITLGIKSVLVPAMFAGTLSFWILTGNKKDKFIFNQKQTITTIFILVAVYTIILAFSLFT